MSPIPAFYYSTRLSLAECPHNHIHPMHHHSLPNPPSQPSTTDIQYFTLQEVVYTKLQPPDSYRCWYWQFENSLKLFSCSSKSCTLQWLFCSVQNLIEDIMLIKGASHATEFSVYFKLFFSLLRVTTYVSWQIHFSTSARRMDLPFHFHFMLCNHCRCSNDEKQWENHIFGQKVFFFLSILPCKHVHFMTFVVTNW